MKSITCFKCGKVGHFSTDCPTTFSVVNSRSTCFQCGRLGHIKKDCPANKPAISGASRAASNRPPTARTFNMTLQDAVRDSDVIAGTLSLNSVSANVLFDSGATKSFISIEFARNLKLKAKPLKETIQIEIANHEVIPVSQVHPECKLDIGGQSFNVDLIPFKLGEFDVILGMDWLSINNAQIDCRKKKVKLVAPGKKEVIFKGKNTKVFDHITSQKVIAKRERSVSSLCSGHLERGAQHSGYPDSQRI